MPEPIIALGIGPGGRPVPIRLTDAGALSVSGGAGAGQGASAVNGVLLLGLNTQGRFVPMAVDENGILAVGVGDVTIINYLNANYVTNTYLTDNYFTETYILANYYTATYINNTYISNTLVTLKGQLIGGKGSHDVGALGPGSEGQVLAVRAAETTGLKFETQSVVIPFIIDGGGQVITAGIKGDVEIPFAARLVAVRLFADLQGSITVDLWKDTYAHYPPVIGDTMISGTKPNLTNQLVNEFTSFGSWISSTFAAGDILRINVDATPATVTRVTLSLTLSRL